MEERPIAALILAGGHGTRLRPLTFTRSKPLIEFCNVPLIQHIFDALQSICCQKIVVALNRSQHDIAAYVNRHNSENRGAEVLLSFEEDEMGTAGAIAAARRHIEGHRFFVLSCGAITSCPLAELLEFHRRKGAEGTLGAARISDGFFYNVILRNESDMIVGFQDKPSATKKNCLIHAGCGVFEPEFLERVPDHPGELESKLFNILVGEGKLFVFEMSGMFVNISDLSDLIDGVGTYAGTENSVVVAKNACVDNSVVLGKSVVIGENCSIGANTKLDRCIVMANTTIGKNCEIVNSIIGWKNNIGDNVIITDMSVLGEKVTVASDTDLTQFYISPYKVVNASNAFVPLAKIII